MKGKFFGFCITILLFTNIVFSQNTKIIASTTSGCAPLKVTFSTSSPLQKYYWDFGNNTSSPFASPISQFSTPGTYLVTLRNGVLGTIIDTITIRTYAKPSIKFTVSQKKICPGTQLDFKDSTKAVPGVEIIKRTWLIGDSVSNLQNPSFSFNKIGKYDVSLEIITKSTECDQTLQSKSFFEVVAAPKDSLYTTPSILLTCDSTLKVTFHNKTTVPSGLRILYKWDFDNGDTSALLNPPIQKYSKGFYTPTLTLRYSQIPTCSTKVGLDVSVGKPQAVIKLTKDSICLDKNSFDPNIFFSTTSIGTYKWYLNDSIFITSNKVGSYKIPTVGNHVLKLVVSSFDGKCSDSTTTKIYVEKLSVVITNTPDISCADISTVQLKATASNPNVIYNWSTSETTQTINVKYKLKDYSYFGINPNLIQTEAHVYVVSKSTGCKADTNSYVALQAPNARFAPSISKGCAPFKVIFTDNSTVSIKTPIVKKIWIMGNGDTITQTNTLPLEYTYNQPGDYNVSLIVQTEGGCSDTSYTNLIEVGKPLTGLVDFTVDKPSVCIGENVHFSVLPNSEKIDAYHYFIEGNNSFNDPKVSDLNWVFKDSIGNQDITLDVENNGCITNISKQNLVDVKGSVPIIDYYSLCSAPTIYNFKSNSKGASSINWDFGDGGNSSNTDATHTFVPSKDYYVSLTTNSADGCDPNTITDTIKVRQVKSVIDLNPNLCINTSWLFSGEQSIDVNNSCSNNSYTWVFADTAKRPLSYNTPFASYKYNKPGKDSISLVVTDINGCSDTSKAYFKVYDIQPQANLDKTAICTPNIVNFDDKSKGDTTLVYWAWDFGDTTNAVTADTSHLYTSPPSSSRTFNAVLTLKDILGCIEKDTFPIKQYTPVSKIQVSDATICFGDTVAFTATDFTEQGSSLNYTWDFGNSTTSTVRDNKVLYPVTQTYKVKLNIVEKVSQCTGQDTMSIQMQDYPKANFYSNVDTIKVICAPRIIKFTDSSTANTSLTYHWDFSSVDKSDVKNPSIYLNGGTYNVAHTVTTSFGCADTAVQQKNLFEPKGTFVADKDTICKGYNVRFSIQDTSQVVSYNWYYGDGSYDENVGETEHQYNFHPPSGVTEAKLILYSHDKRCPVSIQETIYIHEVIADFKRLSKFDTDSSICHSEGAFVFLNKSSHASNFNWDFGDGTSSKVGDTLLSHVYQPGKYEVVLSINDNTYECVDTLRKKINVFKNPDLEINTDTVCLGQTIPLSVKNSEPTTIYAWEPTTGLSKDSVSNPIATLQHTQTYTVISRDTNVCYDTTTVMAGIVEHINLRNWDSTIVIGDSLTLPSPKLDIYSFLWSPLTNMPCSTCVNPRIRPLEDIEYNLNVTDSYNCFNDNFSYKVTVRPETFVKMPTTFTPNGDGNNDILVINGWGLKELVEYKIFNRWGEMIFSTTNFEEGWDGKYKGEPQNVDAYVYKVKALTWRDEEKILEGYINLMR